MAEFLTPNSEVNYQTYPFLSTVSHLRAKSARRLSLVRGQTSHGTDTGTGKTH